MDLIKLINLDAQYDRPGADKICGMAKHGRACEQGPNFDGECPGRSQCIPFRDGDRWKCTRANSSGGACSEGPTSDGRCLHYARCVPDSSYRFKRRRFLWFSSLAFIVLVLAAFAFTNPEQVLDPGPLSSAHAGVIDMNCASCHETDPTNAIEIVQSAFRPSTASQTNHTCLSCHDLGTTSHLAHGVLPTVLGTDGNLEAKCGDCHQEHRGHDQQLSAVSDSTCDSCHSEARSPFPVKHPEFENYLPNNNSLLHYKHHRHIVKHFPSYKEQQYVPGSCSDCHQQESGAATISLKPFAETCGGCHERDVDGSKLDKKSIDFISVPYVDVETLSSAGYDTYNWPSDFGQDLVSPFMLVLISSKHPELNETLQAIYYEDILLGDLTGLTSNELEDVSKVLGLMVSIIDDLRNQGHEGFSSWLQQQDPSRLLAGLPIEMLEASAKSWFAAQEQQTSADLMASGGWTSDLAVLGYRPTGHSDPFLKAWIELSHGRSQASDPIAEMLFDSLLSLSSPGACGKCHELNVDEPLSWGQLGDKTQSFLKFDHSPHTNIEVCISCHVFEENEHEPIEQVCADCHTPTGASNTCTTCHTYHPEPSKVFLPNTALEWTL